MSVINVMDAYLYSARKCPVYVKMKLLWHCEIRIMTTKAVKLKETLQIAIEHQGLLIPLYPNTEDTNSEKPVFSIPPQ